MTTRETVMKELQPLAVRRYGDPVLRRMSVPVTEVTPEIRDLAEHMFVSMHDEDGVGLAAPQVGHNIRLITLATNQPGTEMPVNASPGERLLWDRMPLAVINPEVISVSEETQSVEEGCLSVPGIYGSVRRPVRIVVRARMLSGEMLQIECGGLLARCLLHEIDHLDGVLFIDRMEAAAKRDIEDELGRLEKATKRALKRAAQ
jgi:peptide deformylase